MGGKTEPWFVIRVSPPDMAPPAGCVISLQFEDGAPWAARVRLRVSHRAAASRWGRWRPDWVEKFGQGVVDL